MGNIDLSKEHKLIQEIVTSRRAVREELKNQIVELLKNMPAGYGKSVDSFRNEAIARIEAICPEDS